MTGRGLAPYKQFMLPLGREGGPAWAGGQCQWRPWRTAMFWSI